MLVAEDDESLGRALLSHLSRRAVSGVLAATVGKAVEHAKADTRWAAAIVDIGLPDGSGLDVVRSLRERRPGLPVLVLTGHDDRALANEAQGLGASFAYKPVSVENLDVFLTSALVSPAAKVAQRVGVFVDERGLSKREAEIVRLVVAGATRDTLADTLGVTQNTLKKQIRSVLSKAGASSLDALVRQILVETLEVG